MKRASIEERLSRGTDYVGLAKEAAARPFAAADQDIEYYLGLATKASGKPITDAKRSEIWDVFKHHQTERIKRVEEAIRRYEEQGTPQARSQLAWYTKELARLKAWKPPR